MYFNNMVLVGKVSAENKKNRLVAGFFMVAVHSW